MNAATADPAVSNTLPPGARLQEYELIEILGQGGFGVTYRARDLSLGDEVAIKEYLPSAVAARSGGSVHPLSGEDARDHFQWGLDRFREEARTLARFRHPNIVRVRRLMEGNGTAYMVMEYEAGKTFGRWLKERPGPVPEAELLEILRQLVDGLEPVHAAGFLHRDIKPANIIIRADGSPVLIDFGAARQALGGRSQMLTAIITPGYAPPEQYYTDGDQGPWTDIYALGAVLYLAVTGVKPPEGLARTLDRDGMTPASRAARPHFSERLLAAIDAALRPEARGRPQSLSAWARLLPGGAGGISAQAPRPRRRWVRRIILGGGLVLLVLVLLGQAEDRRKLLRAERAVRTLIAPWPDPLPVLGPEARPVLDAAAADGHAEASWMLAQCLAAERCGEAEREQIDRLIAQACRQGLATACDAATTTQEAK